MKKLIIAFIFCIVLTSCKYTGSTNDTLADNDYSKNVSEESESREEFDEFEESENPKEFEESEKPAESEENTESTEDNSFSLMDLTDEQLKNIQLEQRDDSRLLFSGNLESSIRLSDCEVSVSDYSYKTVRNSSQALYCKGIDSEYGTGAIDTAVASRDYLYFMNRDWASESFKTDYNISKGDMILSLECPDSNISNAKINEIKYSYSIDNLAVYGFIHRSQDVYSVIIDPSYMKGLPVYHSGSELCSYKINGTDVEADTLDLAITEIDNSLKGDLENLGSDYVYARLQLNNFNCSYTTVSGYNSTAELLGYSLISEDTNKILSQQFNIESSDKSDEMTSAYNSLISNTNIFIPDSVVGVSLLDLDFDSTPEVLVSKCPDSWEQMNDENNIKTVDVDVYRMDGNNLVYIDTLWNYHTVVYELGNRLGIKKLDDGSKAWFNMSYKDRKTGEISDTDYLFNLEGNNLVFTEVFRKDSDGNYYYYGEPMIFEKEPFVNEHTGEEFTQLKWGEFSSIYGSWALIGRIKEDYCKDMQDSSFNLYSNPFSVADPYEKPYKIPATKRMLSYYIADLVDSYYLGTYDSSKQYYEYRFLGDFAKPVIYLYPQETTDISVRLDFNGDLTCTYPDYDKGWNVTAEPDGTLINKDDGREYSYLFWEGEGTAYWDLSKGFVVEGKDTLKFLQDTLWNMGLNYKEMNDFIVYWLPQMNKNKYNLISFQTGAYKKSAKLNITPEPDSILRIFMVYKPLNQPVDIAPQDFKPFTREGFTVIEWGGSELK